MKYQSVCSGVEAASLAWMPLGWSPAWFSEIDPFACAVLSTHFPLVENLGDMTKIEGNKYEGKIDILVGGTPCQGFSIVGKRKGLLDERSALCLSYCRLLETMRPRWFVWENVPGVLNTNEGNDFKLFLQKISQIGYSCAWRVLDARYVRVDGFPNAIPQRRKRVFVIGYLGEEWEYPAAVLFERQGETWNSKEGCNKGQKTSRRFENDFGKENRHKRIIGCLATSRANAEHSINFSGTLTCSHDIPIVYEVHSQDSRIKQCVSAFPTVTASYSSGFGHVPIIHENSYIRHLMPIEYERLMGFPDNWTRIPWRGKAEEHCPDSLRYKACGNSMCVNVMRWIGTGIDCIDKGLQK